jgi:hypothetical protein
MTIIACQIGAVSKGISGPVTCRSISEMSRLRSRFSARIDMLP